jgi:hypothetical protein
MTLELPKGIRAAMQTAYLSIDAGWLEEGVPPEKAADFRRMVRRQLASQRLSRLAVASSK